MHPSRCFTHAEDGRSGDGLDGGGGGHQPSLAVSAWPSRGRMEAMEGLAVEV